MWAVHIFKNKIYISTIYIVRELWRNFRNWQISEAAIETFKVPNFIVATLQVANFKVAT